MTTAPAVTRTDEIVAELEREMKRCRFDGDEDGPDDPCIAYSVLEALLAERASLLAHITRLQNGVADDYAEVERMHGEYMIQWRNARKLRTELRELRDSMTYRTSLIGRLEEERDSWKALAESKAAQ